MPPAQKSVRISLLDYKSRFVKILGPGKETQYWQLLQCFLSYKLSKAELDNQVVSTIGKENVILHNQFLRAIYANALCNEAPPPPPSFVHDLSKPVKGIRRKPLVASLSSEEPAVRSNGDGAIPSSPKKGRSAIRDRRAKDRPSPLGFPHNRGEASASHDEETPGSLENGGFKTPDVSRPIRLSQYPAEHSSLELSVPVAPSVKRPRLGFTGSEVTCVEDGKVEGGVAEEIDDEEEIYDDESKGMLNEFIKPPLGCIVSCGGPRMERFVSKFPPPPVTFTLLGDKLEEEILDEDYLPDTEKLHRCMQLLALEKGLEDVDIETARCVNKALDVYMKAIIQPLVELVRARRRGNSVTQEVQTCSKEIDEIGEAAKDSASYQKQQLNGSWPDHSGSRNGHVLSGEQLQGKKRGPISCLDLRVAMDLNPTVLGEDWPTHLEKIAFRAFHPQ
ncbi:hypothetical protein R1flu_019268 [Riccia fluitans]|uniref:Transcriptional adapter 1 n=1 Tax=Riccia fluitans TaxID=41844 RepID=A0ABD1ZJN8_9MARC